MYFAMEEILQSQQTPPTPATRLFRNSPCLSRPLSIPATGTSYPRCRSSSTHMPCFRLCSTSPVRHQTCVLTNAFPSKLVSNKQKHLARRTAIIEQQPHATKYTCRHSITVPTLPRRRRSMHLHDKGPTATQQARRSEVQEIS